MRRIMIEAQLLTLMNADGDRDGKLDLDELKAAFKKAQIPFTNDSAQTVLTRFDTSGDNQLSVDEVRNFLQAQYLAPITPDQALAASTNSLESSTDTDKDSASEEKSVPKTTTNQEEESDV